MRPVLVFYGSCQLEVLYDALKASDVEHKYEMHCIVNWKLMQNKDPLPDIVLKADWLVYQPYHGESPYNTDDILSRLKAEAETVSIPFMSFPAYFPSYGKDARPEPAANTFPFGKFPYVPKLLHQAASVEAALKQLHGQTCNPQEIASRLAASFADMQRREDGCIIKILAWVQKHYKAIRVFHWEQHPCDELMQEVLDQLLNALDIRTSVSVKPNSLKDHVPPILPCMVTGMSLTFEQEARWYHGPNVSLSDYVIEYFRHYSCVNKTPSWSVITILLCQNVS